MTTKTKSESKSKPSARTSAASRKTGKTKPAKTPSALRLVWRDLRQVVGGVVGQEHVTRRPGDGANLDRQFKLIEKSYGADHLDLVLVNGYVAKLLGNAKVVRFLAQHYAEILVEFQKLVDAKTAAT